MNAYAGAPQDYNAPGPADPIEMTDEYKASWERTFAHEFGHLLVLNTHQDLRMEIMPLHKLQVQAKRA